MSEASEAAHKDPLIGQVIQERFRVEAKLGQGGMGAIYLAEHLLLKKRVAIKCLHAGLASNPVVVKRFKNEAVAASSIGHPNIVNVLDMGRFDDGTFFMVLEYLDGREWQHDIDTFGSQAPEKVAHVGIQICDALGAAASKGIVHRDLKPENIFLVERRGNPDFVKVLDFGISKIHDGTGGATKTGELMGTPYYMAPEQVLGEKDITHLADIYALGVIFFQSLSGTVPFEGNTVAQIILKIASQPAPPLGERAGTVPPELCALVDRMMHKDPKERPQTFAEVAGALAPFLAESSALHHKQGDLLVQAAASRSRGPLTGPAEGLASAPGFGARAGLAPQSTGQDWDKTQLPGELQSPKAPSAARTAALSSISRALPALARRRAVVLVALISLGSGALVVWGASGDETNAAAEDSKPNTVRVQISTVPAEAKLLLDGEPLSNPFDREFERSEDTRELRVQLEGYEEERRKVVFAEPQQMIIPLTERAKPEPEQPPPTTSQPQNQAAEPQSQPDGSTRKTGDRERQSGRESAPRSSPQPAPAQSPTSSKTPKPLRKLERGLRDLF